MLISILHKNANIKRVKELTDGMRRDWFVDWLTAVELVGAIRTMIFTVTMIPQLNARSIITSELSLAAVSPRRSFCWNRCSHYTYTRWHHSSKFYPQMYLIHFYLLTYISHSQPAYVLFKIQIGGMKALLFSLSRDFLKHFWCFLLLIMPMFWSFYLYKVYMGMPFQVILYNYAPKVCFLYSCNSLSNFIVK